jgi:hypothetical protein
MRFLLRKSAPFTQLEVARSILAHAGETAAGHHRRRYRSTRYRAHEPLRRKGARLGRLDQHPGAQRAREGQPSLRLRRLFRRSPTTAPSSRFPSERMTPPPGCTSRSRSASPGASTGPAGSSAASETTSVSAAVQLSMNSTTSQATRSYGDSQGVQDDNADQRVAIVAREVAGFCCTDVANKAR